MSNPGARSDPVFWFSNFGISILNVSRFPVSVLIPSHKSCRHVKFAYQTLFTQSIRDGVNSCPCVITWPDLPLATEQPLPRHLKAGHPRIVRTFFSQAYTLTPLLLHSFIPGCITSVALWQDLCLQSTRSAEQSLAGTARKTLSACHAL